MAKRPASYTTVLRAAIADMTEHGYDSAERVAYWQRLLREAAERSLLPDTVMERQLRQALQVIYRRLVEQGQVYKRHPGLSRFTIDKLTPAMKRALDKRIMASADLIRLHRSRAIEQTLSRFAGWSTSLPEGRAAKAGVKKGEVGADIKKSLSSLPFEQRRLLIDQGHKLTANINAVVAEGGGAIAARWHSNWRQHNYNYRPDHKERDEEVYAVRGNWALTQGLMTLGAGYTDSITQPAEEPYCRCHYEYLYSLRALPESMLTKKGTAELERVRGIIAAQRGMVAGGVS